MRGSEGEEEGVRERLSGSERDYERVIRSEK